MALIIYTDGACEPVNPGGVACYGYVVYWNGEIVKRGMGVVTEGEEASNNVAEYGALIKALEHVREAGHEEEEITIRTDSELVVRQVQGSYKVRASRLLPLYLRAMELLDGLDWKIEHVPRKGNKIADALSKRAYKLHVRPIMISISGDFEPYKQRLLELGLAFDAEIKIWHGPVTEEELDDLRKLHGLHLIIESGDESEDTEKS
jgi:ribonuclease HI